MSQSFKSGVVFVFRLISQNETSDIMSYLLEITSNNSCINLILIYYYMLLSFLKWTYFVLNCRLSQNRDLVSVT